MAGNQTRTVELQLKLSGVQNIKELEEVTKDINSELKSLDKNSESFSKLQNLAKRAGYKNQIYSISNYDVVKNTAQIKLITTVKYPL